MKTIKYSIPLLIISLFLNACFGDKKLADVSELGDTSFVNKNFKGNKINYTADMSACQNISTSEIASLYGVAESLVVMDDISKNERRKPNTQPSCMFYLKIGDNDFEWLRGSISIIREIGKDEFMGEIAEAAGTGKNWEEAWAMKKSISKSSEWIKNMGKAALWNERKCNLHIKLEGYTLIIHPLKNILNKSEVAKKRDYKKVAIAMAKASGFVN